MWLFPTILCGLLMQQGVHAFNPVMLAASSSPGDALVSRKGFGAAVAGAALFTTVLPGTASAKSTAKCTNIEECREEGERRSAEQDERDGPKVNLGKGVWYRQLTPGSGEEAKVGDVCYITYQVLTTGGNYMWSLGLGKEPGKNDVGDSYRVKIGKDLPDVPKAVEMAMIGMKPGSVRRVEMPPNLGFETSSWEPAPDNFSGRKKLERYRALLTGNGLQPGYQAELLFEVGLVKIRKPVNKRSKEAEEETGVVVDGDAPAS